LTENETHVLEALYGWWRHHQQSMVTEDDLSRWLVSDGFNHDTSIPIDALVARQWVVRMTPNIVMLTGAGIAEGMSRNL